MASTARAALSRVTHTGPAGKIAGQFFAFTRHPTALATALVAIESLRHPDGRALRPGELGLLKLVATHCDRDGLWWEDVADVARMLGLSPHTVRVCARNLRPLGVLGWYWVKAHHRYPLRRGYWEGVRWQKGKRTNHGGRVWAFCWAKVGVQFEPDRPGTKIAGLIVFDQSRLIDFDQSTSGSPSVGYTDPGLRGPDADRDDSPPASGKPACERETEASETPGAGAGSRAAPPHGRPPAASERQEGNGQGAAERRRAPSAMTPEEIAAAKAGLEFLYRHGKATAPPVSPQRRRNPPGDGQNDS